MKFSILIVERQIGYVALKYNVKVNALESIPFAV